jgi:hypothetical protein
VTLSELALAPAPRHVARLACSALRRRADGVDGARGRRPWGEECGGGDPDRPRARSPIGPTRLNGLRVIRPEDRVDFSAAADQRRTARALDGARIGGASDERPRRRIRHVADVRRPRRSGGSRHAGVAGRAGGTRCARRAGGAGGTHCASGAGGAGGTHCASGAGATRGAGGAGRSPNSRGTPGTGGAGGAGRSVGAGITLGAGVALATLGAGIALGTARALRPGRAGRTSRPTRAAVTSSTLGAGRIPGNLAFALGTRCGGSCQV